MSDDFRKLIEDIEAEARAEGTEGELREMRREFSSALAEPFGVKVGFVAPDAA